jgi:hypothetical protein
MSQWRFWRLPASGKSNRDIDLDTTSFRRFMSGSGTFETCQRALRMSAFEGISEAPFQGRQDRF